MQGGGNHLVPPAQRQQQRGRLLIARPAWTGSDGEDAALQNKENEQEVATDKDEDLAGEACKRADKKRAAKDREEEEEEEEEEEGEREKQEKKEEEDRAVDNENQDEEKEPLLSSPYDTVDQLEEVKVCYEDWTRVMYGVYRLVIGSNGASSQQDRQSQSRDEACDYASPEWLQRIDLASAVDDSSKKLIKTLTDEVDRFARAGYRLQQDGQVSRGEPQRLFDQIIKETAV